MENVTHVNNTMLVFLSYHFALNNVFTIIIMCIIALFGLIGNLHVLVVYGLRLSVLTTYHILINGLAVVDLLTCLIPLLMDILYLRFRYIILDEGVCKFKFVIEYTLLLSSLLLTLTIAVDRYLKICLPSNKHQMSCRQAKVFCFVIPLVVLVIESPLLVWTGLFEEEFMGFDLLTCGIIDKYNKSVGYRVNVASWIVVFYAITVAIVILYIKISRHLKKSIKLQKSLKKKKQEYRKVNGALHFKETEGCIRLPGFHDNVLNCENSANNTNGKRPIFVYGKSVSTVANSSLSLEERTSTTTCLENCVITQAQHETQKNCFSSHEDIANETRTSQNSERKDLLIDDCDVTNTVKYPVRAGSCVKHFVVTESNEDECDSTSSYSSTDISMRYNSLLIEEGLIEIALSQNSGHESTQVSGSNPKNCKSAIDKGGSDTAENGTKADCLDVNLNTIEHRHKINGKLLREKRNKDVARICTAIAVVCVVSLMPSTIAIPLFSIGFQTPFTRLGIRAPFLRCLINPFIYGFMDRKFRSAFRNMYKRPKYEKGTNTA